MEYVLRTYLCVLERGDHRVYRLDRLGRSLKTSTLNFLGRRPVQRLRFSSHDIVIQVCRQSELPVLASLTFDYLR